MSANLPPAFKPIAHYIKIANENASRDPVIYYWSLLWMVFGSSSAPSSSAHFLVETPPTPSEITFDEEAWRRLQKAIDDEKTSTENRDSSREAMDQPDVKNRIEFGEISVKIEEKRLKCDEMRGDIQKMAARILNSRRKLTLFDEKLEKKEEDERRLERKIESSSALIQENSEKKTKDRRAISILIRLGSYRKLALIREILDVFWLKIDGGPASTPPAPRHCHCQVIDTIRGHHLPQLQYLFQHPELSTHAALQNTLHLFDVICRILDFVPKFPISSLRQCLQKTWKKRPDRERFAQSLICLGKNIGQLRESCGIPTMATDRTLGTFEEWHRLVEQKKAVFERPVESAFSPANLMIQMKIV